MRFSPLCAILKSIWKGVDRVERKKLSGGVIVRRCLVVLLVTILLLVLALYGVMFVLAKGPSNYARELFVMSVRETSAVGFLANLYLSDEEIAEIEARRGQQDDLEETTLPWCRSVRARTHTDWWMTTGTGSFWKAFPGRGIWAI